MDFCDRSPSFGPPRWSGANISPTSDGRWASRRLNGCRSRTSPLNAGKPENLRVLTKGGCPHLAQAPNGGPAPLVALAYLCGPPLWPTSVACLSGLPLWPACATCLCDRPLAFMPPALSDEIAERGQGTRPRRKRLWTAATRGEVGWPRQRACARGALRSLVAFVSSLLDDRVAPGLQRQPTA